MAGFLESLFQPLKRTSINDPEIVRVLRGGDSQVTTSTALSIATVFTCARVLSESVMMLPLEIRQRKAAGGSRRAIEHPAFSLLHDLPNPEMTAAEVRQAAMGHLAQWGNAYLQKIPDNSGRLLEMWPLRPDRMEVLRAPDGNLVYKYGNGSGTPRYFQAWEIMHLRGLSGDGLIGYSPIGQARRTFETQARMDQYQDSFYANGARPGMVLKHPGKLSDKAYSRLLESWEDRHQGANNAHKLAILEEGMAAEDIGIPQSDAQFLESKKFSRAEICALFRVPAHMANDMDSATFASIEQMSLEFVIYTLTPWLVLWEQAIFRDLLTEDERKTYYAKHKLQSLLRGDNASRGQFYSIGLQWGWFSINDVREFEDLNPVEGGDTYFVPLNMVPLGQAIKGLTAPTAGGSALASVRAVADYEHPEGCTCGAHRSQAPAQTRADDEDAQETLRQSRVEMARSMHPVLEDIGLRTVRREVRDVRKLVDKHLRKRSESTDFVDAVGEFYKDWNQVVEDNFRAALISYARQSMMAAAAELGEKSKGLTDTLREFVNGYLATFGNGWSGSSRTQIEIVIQEALDAGLDPADQVDERLTRWEETKPKKVADRQSFEALNAFVLASYGAYSITRYRWVASGQSCPFCRQLSGQTAGIEEHIVGEGTELDGGDAGPMRIKRNVRHGPLHGGCDCTVQAER